MFRDSQHVAMGSYDQNELRHHVHSTLMEFNVTLWPQFERYMLR